MNLRDHVARIVVAIGLASALLVGASGCAMVRPYQRERLTDRIMSFKAEAKEDARLTKSFDAREGSTGGNGGAGGGCACN
jgi:hypothetical protein